MSVRISSPDKDVIVGIQCISTIRDQNSGDLQSCNSLVNAAKLNHHECAKKALDEIVVENDHFSLMKHQHCLYIAIDSESFETVEVFLDKGFRLNTKAKYKQWSRVTPLHIASRNLSVKLMTLLLKRGADINSVDEKKESCLHYIIRNGDYTGDKGFLPEVKQKGMDCLKLLLSYNENDTEKRANVDAKDYKGMTPLHLAAIQKNDAYVVKLIER